MEDHDGSLTRGLRVVRANAGARLGVLTIALGHVVMVSVMVMTPLHMSHGHADLQVIGFVISVHILGMFAFSPLVGAAVDRWGGRPVAADRWRGADARVRARLAVDDGVVAAAARRAAAARHRLVVHAHLRLDDADLSRDGAGATGHPGPSEVFMGLAGAGGGAVAGVVVGLYGYGTLALGAAVVGVAVIVLVAVTAPRRSPSV